MSIRSLTIRDDDDERRCPCCVYDQHDCVLCENTRWIDYGLMATYNREGCNG